MAGACALPTSESRRAQVTTAFDSCIKNLCDIQLLSGLVFLISGFATLNCGLSMYHWQVLVCLAWFACVTHFSALTALRHYLSNRPVEKAVRYFLTLILVVMVIVATVPTSFASWRGEHYCKIWATKAMPARCFFDFFEKRSLYHNRRFDQTPSRRLCAPFPFSGIRGGGYLGGGPFTFSLQDLEMTHAFQTALLSSTLLMLSFIGRSIKLFGTLADMSYSRMKIPATAGIRRILTKLLSIQRAVYRFIFRKAFSRDNSHEEKGGDPTRVLLKATWITLALNLDLFNSMIGEIYWLWTLLVWGTLRLVSSLGTDDKSVSEAETQWTFGQIVPVILLVAPVVAMIQTFVSISDEEQHSDQRVVVTDIDLNVLPRALTAATTANSTNANYLAPLSRQRVPLRTTTDERQNAQAGSERADRWLDEANYKEAQWLGPCIANIWATIVFYTALYMTYSYSLQPRDGFKPKATFLLIGLEVSFFFVIPLSYPPACLSVVFLGVYLDDWNARVVPRRVWTPWSKALFWVLGTIVHIPHIWLSWFARLSVWDMHYANVWITWATVMFLVEQ
ncbi:hypothetical protein NPX13_g5544 [Xylaria arbuscula]|uniref:Uncharacterized protein n=1 Tax=Xylaria arbuscula TaxID=114810 RepID=A0A9W8NDU1_9PEZI|nr:hypothetical protein NPX13_g5544 [Xylaria arbuscula]